MHLLVVEGDAQGIEVVRGLISRSRIERHLHDGSAAPHDRQLASPNESKWGEALRAVPPI